MTFSVNRYIKPDSNDTIPTKEAMGLAGMNPVCGISSNHGSLLVNVMNHDKDLETGWKDYKAVTRSLDPTDNLYGIDTNGRVIARHKFDVMDHKDIVEVFNIKTDNVDMIMESIEREASLPYDKRPVHSQSYIYEAFTGKRLLSEDQYLYDPLLEKVELDKWSKIISGEVQNMENVRNNLTNRDEKEAGYIPDSDFPQGTCNIGNPGMILASADIENRQASFNKAIQIIKMTLNKTTSEFKKTITIDIHNRIYANMLRSFCNGQRSTVVIGGWDIWEYTYDANNQDEIEQHDRYFKVMRPFIKTCNANLSTIGYKLQAGTYEEYEEGKLILKCGKSLHESIDTLNESGIPTVFSDKDYGYRLKDWMDGKLNVLFVAGMSGSGKTTLANKLAKRYHCHKVVELDLLSIYLLGKRRDKTPKDIREWAKQEYGKPGPVFKYNMDPKKDIEECKFVKYMISKYKRVVFEGVQIARMYNVDPSIIDNAAIAIKGTSVMKSFIRRLFRDLPTPLELIKIISLYNTYSKEQSKFKDDITKLSSTTHESTEERFHF